MARLKDRIETIDVPSALGLRPPREGHVPGTWRAPSALRAAGLHASLAPARQSTMVVPEYRFELEPGTRLRNLEAIRHVSEELAHLVGQALDECRFPLVIGGDCAVLIGCLVAARQRGEVGLVHIDGHSDFYHPGNFDLASRPGSVAAMDLAIATGRGDPRLTNWGDDLVPLVREEAVVQIGERENLDVDYAFPDIFDTAIRQIDIRTIRSRGIEEAVTIAHSTIQARPIWLHIDLDVLDSVVMPSVDSPGSPGLDYSELEFLIVGLLESGRVLGADITIFDPEIDPDGRHAKAISERLTSAFTG